VSAAPAARNLPEFLKSVATSTASAVSHLDDDDRRVYFLVMLDTLDWAATDDRWRSALALLRHDVEFSAEDPLGREALGLLVQITEQTQDMVLLRAEHSDRGDLQERSRELRGATDRLSRIVHAVTAVHTLGAAS
jgi:thioesterase domain-containing protein